MQSVSLDQSSSAAYSNAGSTQMLPLWLISLLSIILLLLITTTAPAEDLSTQPWQVSDQTVILIVHTNGQSINVRQAFLKHIPFRGRSDQRNTYRYSLLSKTNDVLYSGDFPDPLVRWVDDFSDPEHPKGGRESIAENEFMLKIPYLKDTARIRCERTDAWGNVTPVGVSPIPSLK